MLDTLRRIVEEVNSASNLEQALQTIIQRVKQVMQTDVCSVYLTDPTTQENVLMASEGLNPAAVGHVRIAHEQGLIGLVASRANPVNLENASDHPSYKYIPETGEERYHGFLGAPIIHHRKVLGVLVVQQLVDRSFDEDEVTLLVTIAAQLAGAIAHAEASGGINGLHNSSEPLAGGRPFRGLPGATGVTMGTAVVVYPPADLDAVPDRRTEDIEGELQIFRNAVAAVRREIEKLKVQVAHLPNENQAIFDAYLLILKSNSLIKKTEDRIRTGIMSSTSLRDTIREQVSIFKNMEDDYLSERAQDIRDLGRRILMHIQSKKRGPRVYPQRTILVGDDLTASNLMEVPADQLVGVLSTHGSGSSHVAILARALGIPAVMGAADLPISKVEGLELILDGYQGAVYANASNAIAQEYRRLIKEEAELSANLHSLHDKPAETPDGLRIPLLVNSGLLSDVSSSLDSGAEGVGLYRTEFPFMIRDRFPGEEEQTHIYRQVLQAYAPRPVVLRTLDIGGDKNLSYFPITEANPFLGWRGIRVSLDHPEIFSTQLRAMLRASEGLNNLNILLPMITSVDEVEEAIELVKCAHQDVSGNAQEAIPLPKIGAMIEVPSAIYQVEALSQYVNFFSIGTNDLVQYLLAVDRNNSNVADIYDCLHPAVIHAVHNIIQTANHHGIPVSVCGEMAGDPAAALLLVGMGVNSLSMSTIALPRIKWVVRQFSQHYAQTLLQQVMQMHNTKAIRERLSEELDAAGLGGLLRAGK